MTTMTTTTAVEDVALSSFCTLEASSGRRWSLVAAARGYKRAATASSLICGWRNRGSIRKEGWVVRNTRMRRKRETRQTASSSGHLELHRRRGKPHSALRSLGSASAFLRLRRVFRSAGGEGGPRRKIARPKGKVTSSRLGVVVPWTPHGEPHRPS